MGYYTDHILLSGLEPPPPEFVSVMIKLYGCCPAEYTILPQWTIFKKGYAYANKVGVDGYCWTWDEKKEKEKG